MDLDELVEKLRIFNAERDWDQFHNPKDLLVALMSEVGELADLYRWLSPEEMERIHTDPEKKQKIEEEIADIMTFLLILAYKTNINILEVIEKKMEKNRLKYPLDKSKGVHSNQIEGFKGK